MKSIISLWTGQFEQKRLRTQTVCFFLVTLIFFSSCKKYLNVRSDDALTVPEKLEDLQAILDYTNNMNMYTVGYGEAAADDYFLLESGYNSRGVKDRNAYIWAIDNGTYNTDWARAYLAVYNSNLCLEQLEKINRNATNAIQWDQVKGASLFFRSYHYLQLVWTYAKAYDPASAETDLGIVLRNGTDPNAVSARSNVKECYQRILSDTKSALLYLPNLSLIATQPSKAAAYGLLARTYLTMNMYDSAYKYSNLSLSLKNDLLDFGNNAEVNVTATLPFKILNKETVFLTQMSNSYSSINPSTALVDSVLYQSYHINDLRRQAFFAPRVGYFRFKGSYVGKQFLHFSGITTAEMLLARAECSARMNNKDAALADINTLMIKRWRKTVAYPVITAADAGEALVKILTERRKELLFRGLRWSDIKRLNKSGQTIIPKRVIAGQTYTLQPNENRFALPLPYDIIQMTGMSQNPGW